MTTATTRTARCGCGAEAPSSPDLAFFENLADATANDSCAVCRYTTIAHERFSGRLRDSVRFGVWPKGIAPHEFVLAPAPAHDRFYCGHRGWE